MRKSIVWNDDWMFQKPGEEEVPVRLPHTWNAEDGQDGGNDYFRGPCRYRKRFPRPDWTEEVWLELQGVAMMADVELNGERIAHHDGGFSTFRVNLTEKLQEENEIVVIADNSYTRTVYPQRADFTFYGGIYRDVRMILVPGKHLALGYEGSQGVKITPKVSGDRAVIDMEAWTEGLTEGMAVGFRIQGVGTAEAVVRENHARTALTIENPRLWDGKRDPYLYTTEVSLMEAGGENGSEGKGQEEEDPESPAEAGDIGRLALDQITLRFGCRTFSVDPEKGFYLNGKPLRLCGAARHQDRQGAGNALTRQMHEEDMKLLLEMGANTVRLAHYQHDQYFYDLCDEAGMIVWAEIPYITEHMPEGKENTISQMRELVIQNYHHPSIICWGLSNEITVNTGVTEDLTAHHKALNDLCHELDGTRLTAMAHAFMLDPEDPFVQLSDIRSYNLYYGWYAGDMEYNDVWFDEFHKAHPDVAMGLAEYGADANPAYQSPTPERGDWTEGYQAVYHEHMLEMWRDRPYIWAMQLWNMFDFAADGREEGGKPGQNQKGMVTFDRKLKKDAFYIYKAYLSDEPFVHLCGRRYEKRVEAETEIKVYSNLSKVALYVDGKLYVEQEGDKIFRFRVPIGGVHEIEAYGEKAGRECSDRMVIHKVSQPEPSYFAPGQEVVNWFDKPEISHPEGHYSILDKMKELQKSEEAMELVEAVRKKNAGNYGDVARNVKPSAGMEKIKGEMTLQAILKMSCKGMTPEDISELNAKLNKIKKR